MLRETKRRRSPSMQVKVPKAVLGTLTVCILTACGAANKPTTTIQVLLTDFQFQPNSFTVPAGKEISFAATNSGAVDHSFVIMKLGFEVKGHFSDADRPNIFWEQAFVSPGRSVQS